LLYLGIARSVLLPAYTCVFVNAGQVPFRERQELHMPRTAVVAVAGRRLDAVDTDRPRFPVGRIDSVRKMLSEVLRSERVVALVASAACGADLIALEEAERLGIRRRIILPFDCRKFRNTSVIDRGEDWGLIFDQLIELARREGNLVICEHSEDN